jgi:hypothetical protein
MNRLLLPTILVAGAALASALDAGVSGTWTMNVRGGPHGNATMGLTLKQEGTRVTGTFSSGHSADMDVAGEFTDGQLKIETTEGGDSRIIFSARLKADGTLAGYISSAMGDMTWTASRVAEKKDRE